MVVVVTLQIAANVLPASCLVDPTAGVWRDLPGPVGYRLLLGEQEVIITGTADVRHWFFSHRTTEAIR